MPGDAEKIAHAAGGAAGRSVPWGTGFTIVLALAKLGFGVNISWFWVFAPLWGPWAVIVGLLLLGGVLYLLLLAFIALCSWIGDGWRRRSQRKHREFVARYAS